MQAIRNTWVISKREFLSYFNSPIAYLFIIIYLGTSAFFTFQFGSFFAANQASMQSFFFWQPWLFLVFIPAIGMRLWAEERRSGSIELVFTMPLTSSQVIIGKFLAAWLFIALTLVLTFPIPWTIIWLGDPDNGTLIGGYLGCLLIAGIFLAISSFTSSLSRNQIISFILGMIICLGLNFAGFPAFTDFFRGMFSDLNASALFDTLIYISTLPHYETLQKGIISASDITYALSMIVFGLFLTGATLQIHRS
jgi:ABC-2 type transport system permease protein